MQELLGRITRLDPEASLALRVIACFDELVVGNVNTRGLLAAAASLTGWTAGFCQQHPRRTIRITPRGEVADPSGEGVGHPPQGGMSLQVAEGVDVWLEQGGPPGVNDAIVLERLALAVRSRHTRGPRDPDARRHLAVVVDRDVPLDQRLTSAAAVGLVPARYRVAVAPLFAVWTQHPDGPEDVVPTAHGPLHTLVIPATTTTLAAGPCGIGVATDVEHLDHSFRTATVALRLCERGSTTSLAADTYAGLISMFADEAPGAHYPDVELIPAITAHPWGQATLEALVTAGSARQAARQIGIHHSTLQTRLDAITAALGFDPLDGYGRIRLGVAFIAWRLQHSRVLDLPSPPARPPS